MMTLRFCSSQRERSTAGRYRKGWPIKHSTPQTTAKIEAYEEAGVRGDIGSKQIGRFTKRRRRKLQSVLCEVEIFQQGDWPEKRERRRMWVAARKAAKLV